METSITPPTRMGPALGAAPDLRASLQVLVRRRRYALAALAACLALGVLVTLRSPRIYRATAVVLIDRETPQVLGTVREVYDLGGGAYWNNQEYLQTQCRVIRSRAVAERVVATLGINGPHLAARLRTEGSEGLEAVTAVDSLNGTHQDLREKLAIVGMDRLPSREQIVAELEKVDVVGLVAERVEVSPVRESRLVEISIGDDDPNRAALLANAVANAYLEVNLDTKVDFTRSAVDWLSDQMHDLKDRLERAELALHEFKKANNIVSVSMEDRQTIISQTLTQLNQSLSAAKANRFALESKRGRIQQARGDGGGAEVEAVIDNQLVQRLKASEAELEEDEAEAALKYTDEHPKLLAVRKKLELVERRLRDEIDKILSTRDAQYTEAVDTERRLRSEIEKVKAAALDINKLEIDYSRLRRERDNTEALYEMVLKREKEANLTQMLKVNNVRIHEAARPPSAPIRPRVPFNMLVALVLGVIAGITLAFSVDYLDNSIKNQEQVEQLLGLPFLGIIPSIKAEKDIPLDEARDRDHYIVAHPRSSVAECCRTVRTNLLFMSPDRPARQLLITSAGPREGKSTTVVNLGVAMAQSGMRTVIIDTDMRRPRLHRSFGIPNDAGVSNVILGDAAVADVLHPSDQDGLSIIQCGPIPPNPAELLHAKNFRELVGELSERFDRVLLDSPPVAAVTDALVLGSMVDGVVLVVQAGRTSWQAARQAGRKLEDIGAKILGVVINDFDLDGSQYGAYYRYYYDHRTGYGDEPKKKAV